MWNHVECALNLLFDGICGGSSKDKDSKCSTDGAGYNILADNLLAFKKIGKAYHRGSNFLPQTHVSLSHCVASMSGKV